MIGLKKVMIAGAALGLLAAAPALAQTNRGRTTAPGQMMNSAPSQITNPGPGASGYAPGQLKNNDITPPTGVTGNGASAYAPGRQPSTTSSSTRPRH